MIEIYHVTDDKVNWSLGNSNTPTVFLDVPDSYSRTEQVDLFPCYHHDIELVREVLQKSYDAFPIGCTVRCYVLQHESPARYNGFCDTERFWGVEMEEGEPRPFDIKIVLNGKRTPLHPAMTRYVVSHEYGHAVECWYTYCRKEDNWATNVRPAYKKLRGDYPYVDAYQARQHHANIGEMWANDFRIIMTGYEPEFWPHPGFPRPEAVPGLIEFWMELKEKYATRELRPIKFTDKS